MTDHSEIHEVVFRAGETLFRENEQSYHFFIIHQGSVEVFKTGQGGKKVPLAVVGQGASIGEFAMIDRLPRSATAVAREEVRATRVSEVAYDELIQELPDWAISVMRALVERLRQTNEIVRRAGIVDESLKREIEQIEYDPDASTVTESSPDLLRPEDS